MPLGTIVFRELELFKRAALSLLPGGIVSLFSGMPRFIQIHICADGSILHIGKKHIKLSDLSGASSSPLKSKAVDVVFASDIGLTRTINLPPMSPKHRRNVVQNEILTSTPFSTREIYFAEETDFSDGQGLTKIRLAKKTDVDGILAKLTNAGARIGRVYLQIESSNLLILDKRRTSFPKSRLFRAVNTVLILAIAALPFFHSRSLLVTAEKQLSIALEEKGKLFDQAAEAAQKHQTFEDQAALVMQVSEAIGQNTDVLIILSELTGVLPDQVWLQSISVNTGQILISGISKLPVLELLAVLQGSSQFSNPTLSGPVVKTSDGVSERFRIELERGSK